MNENHAATYLQIDLQNLFFEARNKGQKIDFDKVWHFFNDRETETLTVASVYLVRGEDFDSTKFEAKLTTLGYEIKAKNVVKFTKGTKIMFQNSNHDVNITIDCLDRIDTFNKWILMSGDGDFADLCKYLKQRKKKIEICVEAPNGLLFAPEIKCKLRDENKPLDHSIENIEKFVVTI